MEAMLIRLLVGILVIVICQYILGAVPVREPANRIIFLVTIVLVVLWLISGSVGFSVP